jgi:hypothetical protein
MVVFQCDTRINGPGIKVVELLDAFDDMALDRFG